MSHDGTHNPEYSPERDAEAVARLAKLPPLEYDRARVEEAKRLGLGIRIATLDRLVAREQGDHGNGDAAGGTAVLFPEPEPWPDPVDGASLLDALADTFTRHVVLPAGGADAVALWCLHAHAHDTVAISPILAITSPAPECGKSTLLTLLGALVPKPLVTSNITAAPLFRSVEKWKPTLLIDEADSFLRDNEELRGVVNSGHNRGGAFVIRSVGLDHEPRQFTTWAPKAIALIGKLAPTLSSRAIHIEMRRLAPGETVEDFRADRLDHLVPLARQAARWVDDHDTALRDAEPDMPPILTGRRADNWRPLFAIADVAGGGWPERARRAAEALSAGRSDETAAELLLEDIRAIFAERGEDRISSAALAVALAAMEDRPWPEWRAAKPITARGIAKLLDGFGIAPKQIWTGGGNVRGYTITQFNDAFGRYLPLLSARPLDVNETAGYSPNQSARDAQGLALAEPLKANETGRSSGLADRKREPRDESTVDEDLVLDDGAGEWTDWGENV